MTMLIRKAVLSDAPQLGKVIVESWRTTYQGIVSDAYLKGMNPLSSAKRFEADIVDSSKSRFFYVAEVGKEVVGFVVGGVQRKNPEPDTGELYAIYLLKDFQSKGIGRQLFTACTENLLAMGFRKMIVYVLTENPYRRFYESTSGVLEPYDGEVEIGGKLFKPLKYVWSLRTT